MGTRLLPSRDQAILVAPLSRAGTETEFLPLVLILPLLNSDFIGIGKVGGVTRLLYLIFPKLPL